jgi:hypothetical protein
MAAGRRRLVGALHIAQCQGAHRHRRVTVGTAVGRYGCLDADSARNPLSFRGFSVSEHTVGSMDRSHVFALAEELAELTCEHLPWSDQRVIALELGVGECDLAIEDMVRATSHEALPVPGRIVARLHEWLDGCDAIARTDAAQLRGYVNRLRCA